MVIPLIFIFSSCREMLTITKSLVVKIQNLAVNQESRPVKLYPDMLNINASGSFMFCAEFLINLGDIL